MSKGYSAWTKATNAIAWAAATDEADRQARLNGRTAWSVDDYNLACHEYDRLTALVDVEAWAKRLAADLAEHRD